jgi:hypothetical protein
MKKKNNIQFYSQNNRGKRNGGSYNFRGRGHYSKGFQAYNYRKFYENLQLYNQQYFNYYYPYNPNESLNRIEKYILANYNNLIDINKKNSNILSEINTDCKFFVIKSFSEEDIHKSIKYGVWSSSKNGNIILSKAFNNTKEKGSFVYLIFSCNGSGRCVGVAKMKSSCDFNKTFNYWTQDNKWTGLFNVEWIFIKDVPLKEFQNIIIIMRGGEIQPITYARDAQEIPYEQAKIMLDIFEKYENSNTILEHFEFYDMRQANYEKNIRLQKMNQYNYFI